MEVEKVKFNIFYSNIYRRYAKRDTTVNYFALKKEFFKIFIFREAIRKAFDMWSEVVPLDFTEIPEASSDADIKIGFKTGEHGDYWPFDGKSHFFIFEN